MFGVAGCSGTTSPDPGSDPPAAPGDPPQTETRKGGTEGDAAGGGKPTAKLALRFASGRGTLTGSVLAARGAPLLRSVRITLPRGLTRKGRRSLTVAARGAGSAKLGIKARGLKPSRALVRRLRRRARVLRVGLKVTSASGGTAALRLRLAARM